MELVNSSPRPYNIQEAIDKLSEIDFSLSVQYPSLEILSELCKIINKLGSEFLILNAQISSIREKLQLKNSEKAELEQLEDRVAIIGKAQIYAHKIQSKFETLEYSQIRELYREDIQKHVIEHAPLPFLMKQVDEIAHNLESDANKKLENNFDTGLHNETTKESLEADIDAFNNLSRIAEKFSRSSADIESRDLSSEDLHHLERILRCLDAIKNQTHELSQLYDLMFAMLGEFAKAFEKGMSFLMKLDPQGETMAVLRKIQRQQESPNDAEKMWWFCRVSEVYWQYNDPFECHIGQNGIAQILLDALDGKENPATAFVIGLNDTQKKELREKSILLKDTAGFVKDITIQTGANSKFRSEVFKVRKEFLRKKRVENLNKKIPISINIVGGGPGGLMRAMIAAVKGADALVIEMRDSYTRDNMVKINDSIVMKYFGVKERLVEKGLIDPNKISIEVSLKNLEYVLNEIAKEIYGHEDFLLKGQVVDILVGPNGKAACLIQEGKRNDPTKSSVREADLIIDSTGARGHVARMMGVQSEQFATSQMMIALAMKIKNSVTEKSTSEELLVSISLSSPHQNYSLIQPSIENQCSLRELNNLKSHLQQKENQFYSQIISFEEAISKSILPRDKQGSNIYFPDLYRGNIESYLPQNSIEDLKLLWGDKTPDYDIELLKEVKRSRFFFKFKLEREKVEAELEKLLYKIASNQQGKKCIRKENVIQLAPFNIEINQRNPASIICGHSVVMFSGDSLATPEPKSGSGAGHALSGGTIFSKVLDDKRNGASLEQIQTMFNHGSQIQMDQVTIIGISARKEIARQSPGLTLEFTLKEASKYGFLTDEEINFLTPVIAKKDCGGILSKMEESQLIEIENKIQSKKESNSARETILEDLKDLIAKSKSYI